MFELSDILPHYARMSLSEKGFIIFKSPEIAERLKGKIVVRFPEEKVKVILFHNPVHTVGVFRLNNNK